MSFIGHLFSVKQLVIHMVKGIKCTDRFKSELFHLVMNVSKL